MKSAGYGAAVEWHQDYAFYPHTNDDILAIGVIIDDMKIENGPLMVYPGSQKGPVYDHHVEGVFAGAMLPEDNGLNTNDAVPLDGTGRVHLNSSWPDGAWIRAEHVRAGPAHLILRNDGCRCVSPDGINDALGWD